MERSPPGWVADLFVVCAAILLSALYMITGLSADPPRPVPWRDELVYGGAALAVLFLFRRRWPVALVIVLIPPAVLSVTGSSAATVALYSLATRRSWQVAAAAGAFLTSVLVGSYALAAEYFPEPQGWWEAVIFVVLLHVTVVSFGMLVRSQRMLMLSLREQARRTKETQRRREEDARYRERERLAREMHDVLAHRLSLLALHAGALEVRRTASAEETRAAGAIRQGAHDALESLRQVIGMLRENGDSGSEKPQPGMTDIPALVRESQRAGVGVKLDLSELQDLPDSVGRHAYRIVEEGLRDAREHSPGSSVVVTIDREADGGLVIELTHPPGSGDSGTEVTESVAGLVGLRERIDLVGGRLEHGRTSTGEHFLRAWLPI